MRKTFFLTGFFISRSARRKGLRLLGICEKKKVLTREYDCSMIKIFSFDKADKVLYNKSILTEGSFVRVFHWRYGVLSHARGRGGGSHSGADDPGGDLPVLSAAVHHGPHDGDGTGEKGGQRRAQEPGRQGDLRPGHCLFAGRGLLQRKRKLESALPGESG